ncbi:hypothetical protein V8E54_008391 [Elaphomyces granulatus]
MMIVNAAGRAMTDVTDDSQLCDVTDDQKPPGTRSYLIVGLPDPHPATMLFMGGPIVLLAVDMDGILKQDMPAATLVFVRSASNSQSTASLQRWFKASLNCCGMESVLPDGEHIVLELPGSVGHRVVEQKLVCWSTLGATRGRQPKEVPEINAESAKLILASLWEDLAAASLHANSRATNIRSLTSCKIMHLNPARAVRFEDFTPSIQLSGRGPL